MARKGRKLTTRHKLRLSEAMKRSWRIRRGAVDPGEKMNPYLEAAWNRIEVMPLSEVKKIAAQYLAVQIQNEARQKRLAKERNSND